MTNFDAMKLENADPEGIDDSLRKIEKSFQIKFDSIELKNVKTFGDICDVVTK